jgi:pyruvate ferredoxin oxidoreductase delta subunit
MTPAKKTTADRSAAHKKSGPAKVRQPKLTEPAWDVSEVDEWGPEEHQLGATIPEAGNSVYNETGGWRSQRPEFHPEKCDGCMLCYFYCPDAAIIVEDDRAVEMDEAHCKGCGICAKECPRGAITMNAEEKE